MKNLKSYMHIAIYTDCGNVKTKQRLIVVVLSYKILNYIHILTGDSIYENNVLWRFKHMGIYS